MMKIRQLATYLRSWLGMFGSHGLVSCQRGSVLVVTIIAVTIAATLGTAIYSFVSTSSLTQVGSMNDTKAYYLAESGGHYAIKRLIAIDSSNATTRNALLTELAAAPFTVTDGGQFTLQSFSYTASGGFAQYSFSAKGTPPNAAISRSISYIVKVPDQAGVNIPFDGSGATLNANNWNTSGNAALDTINQKVTLNSGTTQSQVSLDWNNASSTLPDLATAWSNDNGMLSYEVQVKVKLNTSANKDVAAGISFRLNTQGDTNFSNDSFYGLSYVWCYDHVDLPAFCGTDSSKTYIVLWKQASNGTKTVIGKQLASTVSTSLVSSSKLVSWATLVVRIQEQLDPVSGVRENLIYAFAGDPVTSPKGTIHWDYTKYAAVKWESSFSGTDCSGGLKSFVADTSFLSTNFDTQNPDEVGVHTLGATTAELADLALRFGFNGGEASICTADGPGTLYLKSSTYSVSEGGGTATITVGRKSGAAGTVGVSYATTAGGTATAASDYTAASGTLSWSGGDTADKSFTIPIIDDADYESSETVNLAITSATGGATLGTPNTAVLTIVDNDGVRVLNGWPSTAISSGTSSSRSGTFATSAGSNRFMVCAVTAELSSESSSFSVSGTYGGQNFTTLKSTASLSSSRQHAWLGYVKESAIAARTSDTVSVSITAGQSTSASDLYCASYQGVDQSNPVAGSRANVNSGSSTVSFGGNVTVVNGGYIFYALAANGASSTPPSGYLEHWDKAVNSYSTSGASKAVTVSGTENKSWSLSTSERWGLAVGSLNPAVGGGSAGTIDLSATTYSVNENGGTVTITATRTNGSTGAVSVNYATSNGTATAGSDYTAASGSLSWANGDTASKTFTISITDDSLAENDETVNITLSNPTGGAVLGGNSAVLTIVDNEPNVTVLDAWPSTPQLTGTTGNMSGTYTISAGTNRLLVVAVSCFDSGGSSGQTFSATYGGKTLTQAKLENSNRRQTWIAYLKESDIASRSGSTLSVNVSGTHTGVSAFIASYSKVNQTSPIAASGGTYLNDTNNAAINSSSLTVASGTYGIYNWSGSSGVSRTSDNETYTERADLDSGGVRVGVASKAFSASGATRPTVQWSANIRASVSIIVLQ